LGFSQGGLFMRAYVERCNSPPVRTLVTFGSPHSGTADVPNCHDNSDVSCSIMRGIVRRSAYTNWAQNDVIQAQYYKDMSQLSNYLEYSKFLPFVNNEHSIKNATYKANLVKLDKFVMIKFTNDTMVDPKETAWFWFYEDEKDTEVVELRNSKIYNEDWIGLKHLDNMNRLVFEECPGQHMKFTTDYLKSVIVRHLNRKVSSNKMTLVQQL